MPGVKRPRLPFLDWVRGLAAVIMLQGHAFDAFARADLRTSGPFIYSQFVGGLPPAIFLFLAGITLSFSMARGDRLNPGWRTRWTGALKRARYLLILAFLFRIQLWLFSAGAAPWTDLLKVDVLNCMGVTMLLLSPLALLGKEQRLKVAATVGIGFAALSPLVSLMNTTWIPWPVRDYLVPNAAFFSLFPWAAFLAFGVAAGTVLKSVQADQMHRVMLWSTIVGFILAFGGQYISNLPFDVYPKSDFWLNSPWLVVIKLGVVLILTGLAFLWTEHLLHERWSWIKQIGTTSLLVYWVHIEVVYGRWFSAYKQNLNNYECAAFAILLIIGMLALSVLRTRAGDLRLPQWVPDWIAGRTALSPRRASGD